MACKKQSKTESTKPAKAKKTTTKIAVLEVKEQPKTTKKIVKRSEETKPTKTVAKKTEAKSVKKIADKKTTAKAKPEVIEAKTAKKAVKTKQTQTAKKAVEIKTTANVKKTSKKQVVDVKPLIAIDYGGKVYLTNVRIGSVDKERLRTEAAKAKQSLQAYISTSIENRFNGLSKKKIALKAQVGRDAVLACRFTKEMKDKVLKAAMDSKQTVSAYILDTLFGNY